MGEIAVRPAAAVDHPRLAAMLARSFHDDPIFTWLVPDETRRPRKLERLFGTMLKGFPSQWEASTTTSPDCAGVAMWAPPDHWKLGLGVQLRMIPGVLRAIGMAIPKYLAVFSEIEKHHLHEPHWYLAGLGTDPPHQRKGIGAALMQPVFERCDREGLPAYLETQKEKNVPYYGHHGFDVIEEMDLPKGGPHLWLMRRPPQS